MTEARTTSHDKRIVELATFYVGDALCGMDILKVQEINKLMQMTKVPQAPDYVVGILNLRGQIVTIIDLGLKLGLGATDISHRQFRRRPRWSLGEKNKRCGFGRHGTAGGGAGQYARYSGRIFHWGLQNRNQSHWNIECRQSVEHRGLTDQ